ncbi:Heat stress transcription factor A-5 [Camellia lanceoleosa]|uniref:Heat stress transcription factor A-5 n=1 Tax=Camellia lanceoleosa TaxID=1840588 RepID=A0ACC0GRJ9_9ERIC|nr:Heat stress transcription factor A-5 [Camellia lanceoleosa]
MVATGKQPRNPFTATVTLTVLQLTKRVAFEEEIDKLSREKVALEKVAHEKAALLSVSKLQLEDSTQRVNGMEQRQDKLLNHLETAIQNQNFVEHLAGNLKLWIFQHIIRKGVYLKLITPSQFQRIALWTTIAALGPSLGTFSPKISQTS